MNTITLEKAVVFSLRNSLFAFEYKSILTPIKRQKIAVAMVDLMERLSGKENTPSVATMSEYIRKGTTKIEEKSAFVSRATNLSFCAVEGTTSIATEKDGELILVNGLENEACFIFSENEDGVYTQTELEPERALENITVESVTIHWIEGAQTDTFPLVFTSDEKQTALQKAQGWTCRKAYDAPRNGGYDKCSYTIKFNDGTTYDGRLELQHPDHNANTYKFAYQMISFVSFYTGKNCPLHMNPKEYQHFILNAGEESARECCEWLNTYRVPLLEAVNGRALNKAETMALTVY